MLLRELSEAAGASGAETEVRDIVRAAAKPWCDRVYTDILGSVICEKGLSLAGPRVLVTAHMDEVAFMVVAVEQDGLLRFRPVGGVDHRVVVAKQVLVGPRKINGVIGAKAIHLQDKDERTRPLEWEELFIDIGARDGVEARLHVQPGDVAVFATAFEAFGERLVKGKALDNRAGCALLLDVMQEAFAAPVVFAFTVQEEIGRRGAGPVAHRVRPDLAIVVEATVCADVGGTPGHEQGTVLGKGPAISVTDRSTVYHHGFRDYLIRVAIDEGIPWQRRRIAGGGNDAGTIHLSGGGVPTAAVSVPARYIHAPCQLVSLDDYEHSRRLLVAALRGIERGGFAGA